MKKFLSVCTIVAATAVVMSNPVEAKGPMAPQPGGPKIVKQVAPQPKVVHQAMPQKQVVHYVAPRPVIQPVVIHHQNPCYNWHCNHNRNVVVYHSHDNRAANVAAIALGTIGVAALVSAVI